MSLAIDAISLRIRDADVGDLAAIREIYNQGIVDRIATLDEDPKTEEAIREWYAAHADRYSVLVAERDGRTVGWASLNPYSHRCAYRGVADLSIYIERGARGTGVGTQSSRHSNAAPKRRVSTSSCSLRFRSTTLGFGCTGNSAFAPLERSESKGCSMAASSTSSPWRKS